MRLLHAERLEFEEFFDTQIPPYLILSHRWGEKEVSYQQMNKKRAENGPGLTKILNLCTLALEKQHTWVWIDTCCIDKKSSAELSEAINSMFKWYQSAEECIVYLSDVSVGDQEASDQDFETRFSASSWFTRGWTLQELLAPRQLTFYDTDWKEIGGKDLLCGLISATTGIREAFIARNAMPPLPPYKASVAARMSWVARRKTSRSEDMAYCLLGLFDINMPLLYGEGAEKAFVRLQTEIIKESDDETIFAWTANLELSGILATDPSFFADSAAIHTSPVAGINNSELRSWITNKGLALQIPDRDWPADESHMSGTVISIHLHIYCRGIPLGIQVQCISRNVWYRRTCQSLINMRIPSYPQDQDNSHVIYVATSQSQVRQREDFKIAITRCSWWAADPITLGLDNKRNTRR